MTDVAEEPEVENDIQEGMSPSRTTQNREFGQDDQQFGGGAGEQEYGTFIAPSEESDSAQFRGDLLPDDLENEKVADFDEEAARAAKAKANQDKPKRADFQYEAA